MRGCETMLGGHRAIIFATFLIEIEIKAEPHT